MTENEAIKILRKDSCYECAQGTDSPVNCECWECRVAEATRAAIKALEEVQQYRKIGTVEECREAMEKQKPEKTIYTGISAGILGKKKYYKCPRCGNQELEKWMNERQNTNYCWDCGQKLGWED